MFERIIFEKLNEHLWIMDDNHEATGYLVVGQDRALVIDTMNGYEDVRAVVRTVTDLPVMVVNTHGHCDHIYGNIYFDKAYLNPKDNEIAKKHMSFPDFVTALKERGAVMPPFSPIHGGEVLDLGGLTIEVHEIPGHTPGGIMLYIREDRILFTGDSINHHLWMQLEESLMLKDYLKVLDGLEAVFQKTDYILHGHARGFDDISLVYKLKKGVEELVNQTGRDITDADPEYKWFGGCDKIHQFDDDGSAICYSLSKL